MAIYDTTDFKEISIADPSKEPENAFSIDIREPAAPSVTAPYMLDSYTISFHGLFLLDIVRLLNLGYTNIKFEVLSPYAEEVASSRAPLPSGLEFTDMIDIFYTSLLTEPTGTTREDRCFFYNDINLASHKPTAARKSISYNTQGSSVLEVIPDEFEPARNIKPFNGDTKKLYRDIILESSDSITDLANCKFPRTFEGNQSSPSVTNAHPAKHIGFALGNPDKSDNFWKYWKSAYNYSNVGRLYNSEIKVEEYPGSASAPILLPMILVNTLDGTGKAGFSIDDIVEILNLEFELVITAYRDESLPRFGDIADDYRKVVRIPKLNLLRLAGNSLAAKCAAEPANISVVRNASEFEDIASLTNSLQNTIYLRLIEKYYDISENKVKNGQSSLVKLSPLESTTVAIGYNQNHTIRWYESYMIPYAVYSLPLKPVIPISISRTKPTPEEIRNSRQTFVHCYYSDGSLDVVGRDFPPDTEEYRLYLDVKQFKTSRPCGTNRSKYLYLKKISQESSNFNLSVNIPNLSPGAYRVIVDSYKNSCITQTSESVFSVKGATLEQADSDFVLSCTPEPMSDRLQIVERSTPDNISSIVLGAVDPLFSDFFADGFAQNAPKSQIVTAYKIYRLDRSLGTYEDVTPGGSYIGAGTYDISSPPASEDQNKDVKYYVEQYASFAGNLTVDNFPLATSERLGTERYYYDYFKFKSPEALRKGALPALHALNNDARASLQYNSFLEYGYTQTKAVTSVFNFDEGPITVHAESYNSMGTVNKIRMNFGVEGISQIDHIIIVGDVGGYKSIVAAIPFPVLDCLDGRLEYCDYKLGNVLGTVQYHIYCILNTGLMYSTGTTTRTVNPNDKIYQLIGPVS